MPISENIKRIKEEVAAVAAKHHGQRVTLIAVSKQKPISDIRAALETGHNDFGENRWQEVQTKWLTLKEEYPHARLHFIGTMQSRKLKAIMSVCDVIHSVDRLSLIDDYARIRDAIHKSPDVFLQVNMGGEAQKSGAAVDEAAHLVEECHARAIPLVGLMCLPPMGEGRRYFGEMAALAREMSLTQLSMGMSDDYQDAIAAGATHIRIGTAIFGARHKA